MNIAIYTLAFIGGFAVVNWAYLIIYHFIETRIARKSPANLVLYNMEKKAPPPPAPKPSNTDKK
jgi:hypothetical protein